MPEPAKKERWAIPAETLHEVERAVEDHHVTIRTVRALFSARMDQERGLSYQEVYDLDLTLGQSVERLAERCEAWYGKRREALGLPDDPPRGPAGPRPVGAEMGDSHA